MSQGTEMVVSSGGNAVMTMETIEGAQNIARIAKIMAASTMVPEHFRSSVTKKRGNEWETVENPAAIANCVIAIDMANRMGIGILPAFQNLYVIEGRPSWSSTFILAALNRSGKFRGGVRFIMSPEGPEQTVEYTVTEWVNRERTRVKKTAVIRDRQCYCEAIEASTGEVVRGPTVSMRMAVAEGWLTKEGSKWQTMPEVMLQYRAASFFGRLAAPEVLLGIPAADELEDSLAVEPAPVAPQVVDVTSAPVAAPQAPAAAARAAARGRTAPKAEAAPPAVVESRPEPATAPEPVQTAPVADEVEPEPEHEEPPPAESGFTLDGGAPKPYSDAERNAKLTNARNVPEGLRRKAAKIAKEQNLREPIDACVALHNGDADLWKRAVGGGEMSELALESFLQTLAETAP